MKSRKREWKAALTSAAEQIEQPTPEAVAAALGTTTKMLHTVMARYGFTHEEIGIFRRNAGQKACRERWVAIFKAEAKRICGKPTIREVAAGLGMSYDAARKKLNVYKIARSEVGLSFGSPTHENRGPRRQAEYPSWLDDQESALRHEHDEYYRQVPSARMSSLIAISHKDRLTLDQRGCQADVSTHAHYVGKRTASPQERAAANESAVKLALMVARLDYDSQVIVAEVLGALAESDWTPTTAELSAQTGRTVEEIESVLSSLRQHHERAIA